MGHSIQLIFLAFVPALVKKDIFRLNVPVFSCVPGKRPENGIQSQSIQYQLGIILAIVAHSLAAGIKHSA